LTVAKLVAVLLKSSRQALTIAVVASALTIAVVASALTLWASTAPASAADPVIAAAGDIACAPSDPQFNGGAGSTAFCRQRYTSDLLVNAGLTAVLPLGDVQYESGSLIEFQGSYHPSWGRVKSISHPVVGNHETSNGYWDYFNGLRASDGPAGPDGKGWYSYDIGGWHIVALNSNCSWVSGCGPGSPQEQWLRADLAAHPASCTLAYWHHPLFSSKTPDPSTRTFWEHLYAAGADVVLNGHVHNYERFSPQTPAGKYDPVKGIREFVVGTGGKSLEASGTPAHNSAARISSSFGVLKLALGPTSFQWQFVTESGAVRDSGTANCNVVPGEPAPPAPTAAGPPVAPTAQTPAGGVRCTVVGTPGDDVLVGTPGRDVICGLGGNDRLLGAAGKDVLAGGGGEDRLGGGDGGDLLFGGSGGDRLAGGSGNDRLHGGNGRDRLRGGPGGDRLLDGRGSDRLRGNAGNDALIASLYRRDRDLVSGGRGRDKASVNKRDRVRSVERFFRVQRVPTSGPRGS
jgi:hypothetical protein